jgi:hypothetical protein
MTREEALLAEIHNLPKNQQAGAVDAALRLIRNLAKQVADKPSDEPHQRRRAGGRPGAYVMAPDFDEPLEEFEEYM